MEPFSSSQQPDEGYSEHPLNPSSAQLAVTDSPARLTAWLEANVDKLSVSSKTRLAMTILNELPTTVVSDIVMNHLHPRLYIDFVDYLPPEICLKIFGFLDPNSLIHVAMCCHRWYELSVDRKLWQHLYCYEGWKALEAEIELAEERINDAQRHSRRFQSFDDGHAHKRRAVSDLTDDTDYEMIDADQDVVPNSLFGGPQRGASGSSAKTTGSVVQHIGNLKMKSPSPLHETNSRQSKGKGKAVAEPPEPSPHRRAPDSKLWMYDARNARYRMNWNQLYTLRRRLESNWDKGRYTNFQLPRPEYPEEGHNECIYTLQYNAEFLVSGSRDKTIRIWNLPTRRLARPPLKEHGGSVLCLQFDSSPEEDLIVSGSSDSDVIIWKFSTGQVLQRLRDAHRESVLNVKFDKRILVTCSKDKTIKVFNRVPLRAGDVGYGTVGSVPTNLKNYGYDDSPLDQLPIKPPYTMIGSLEGHGAAVNAVQICDNEVVSASGDRHIKVWDWPNQICKRTFLGHAKGIACVQYDGRRIVSGSSDHNVKIFDRETGLEVASLNAHVELVRTVQAGFGDLPFSAEEDRLAAREADRAYFEARESGRLSELEQMRNRPLNAGSSRPEDITAYGARLPPGGGGGPYGRIVSGSYDRTIIIWRRDRDGSWIKAHVLRQEEGAVAALRETEQATPAPRPADNSSTGAEPNLAAARNPGQGAMSISSIVQSPPASSASAPPSLQQPPPGPPQQHPSGIRRQMILEEYVQQGPDILAQLLHSRPEFLAYNSELQSAIDHEPSALRRQQLRRVVEAAYGRTAHSRSSARPNAHGASGSVAGGSAGAQPSSNFTLPPLNQTLNRPPAQQSSIHQLLHQPQPQQYVQSGMSARNSPPRIPPPPPPGQAQEHQAIQLPPPTDATTPARIFKLQFDARRIICCSQTSTIVGWDFCNGDPELEEASRFFGTVE